MQYDKKKSYFNNNKPNEFWNACIIKTSSAVINYLNLRMGLVKLHGVVLMLEFAKVNADI